MPTLKQLAFFSLADFLRRISSPVRPEEVWPQIEGHFLYKHYSAKWHELSPRKQRKAWEKISQLIAKVGYATRPYCIRCGECCKNGSPSLYLEDAFLINSGHLSKSALFTIRTGELAYSNEEGKLVRTKKELIKIKEHKGRQCIFFQEENNRCEIYPYRPLQCRIMACWQPEKFKTLKKKRPLKRKDLIGNNTPLWAVISLHERRCSVTELINLLKQKDKGAKERLQEMAYYDLQIRHCLKENFQIPTQELEFYLGRPISTLIRLYQNVV